jgi:hypothetical protein
MHHAIARRLTSLLVISPWLILGVACSGSPSSPTSTTAALSTVSFATSTVTGGLPATGTVTLTAAAPSSGIVVSLASSSDQVVVPATVTVASGSSSQTFDAQTSASANPVTATITATYANVSRTATITVGKLAIQSFSVSPTAITAGAEALGTLILTAPAPDGGARVSLVSSSTAASVPASVTIPAGSASEVFAIDAAPTSTPTDTTITATFDLSGSARSTTLTIGRLAIQSLTLGITSLPGGLPATGTVLLTVTAPADVTVALSSNSPVAIVPSSVTIPAGALGQSFPIETVNAPPTTTATITATYAGSTQTATLTVFALPVVASVKCASTVPPGGTSVSCIGTLASPAPAGGAVLSISTSDDTQAGPVPSQVNVRASSQTFQFDVVTAMQTSAVTVVISISDAPSGVVLFSQAFTINPS